MKYIEEDLIPTNKASIGQRKLVHEVGVNDAWYKVNRYETIDGVKKVVWKCPFYVKWCDMLRRCYSEKYHEKNPTYKDCIVCEEWHTFSNFKSWMETQDWEGKCLDKDIITRNNKVYSPETCVFVSGTLNKLLLDRGALRGEHKIGVYLNKRAGRYTVRCKNGKGKVVSLGSFPTEQEAYKTYVNYKHTLIVKVAHEQEDIRVKEGLLLHAQILLDTLEE